MSSRDIIESYALEIVSRARSIQKRCETLSSGYYASEAPKDLAKTIEYICDNLSKAVITIFNTTPFEGGDDNLDSPYLLNLTDRLIQILGQDVRYIEAAKIENLPWSIIPSFQNLARSLFPNFQIMIRPEWEYNYSVDLSDLRATYQNYLTEFSDYLPNNFDKEISSLKNPFFLITFPSLEKKNILLHPLLGHELGHLFADKYLNKDRKDKFANDINDIIEVITEKQLKDTPLPEGDLFRAPFKTHNMELALNFWVRGLEELLSDIVGAILFGPAAIFACIELAIQQGIDIMPSENNSFYPPWRMRIREVLKIIDNYGEGYFPLRNSNFSPTQRDKINKRYENIKKFTGTKKDIDLLTENPIRKIAYEHVATHIDTGVNFLLNDCKLKDHLIKATVLYENLPHLIERLVNDIPPNAIENSIEERENASLVEIINSSWFYKISWSDVVFNRDGNFVEATYSKRNRVNNLTLKAIEYAELAKEYDEESK